MTTVRRQGRFAKRRYQTKRERKVSDKDQRDREVESRVWEKIYPLQVKNSELEAEVKRLHLIIAGHQQKIATMKAFAQACVGVSQES